MILARRIRALSNDDLLRMTLDAVRDPDGDAQEFGFRQCDDLLEAELRRRLADWLKEDDERE
jgi:hypothetical protein